MADRSAPLSFDNTEIAFSYKSDRELRKSAFLFNLVNSNFITQVGTRLTPLVFKLNLPFQGIIRATIFDQFCGGESLEDSAAVINKLAQFGVDTILDYGVEAKESEEEFDKSMNGFLKSIQFAKENRHVSFISIKVTGMCRFSLLEKLHAWSSLDEQEKQEWQRTRARVERICSSACEANIGVMIDAEESWIQNPIDDLTTEMMQQFNRNQPIVYNTYQMYRTDRLAFLRRTFEQAQSENFLLGAKLVRGAYMEKERKHAQQLNRPSPIQPDKTSTDRDYNEAVKFCLDHLDIISCCVASHNEFSNQLAAQLCGGKGLPGNHPHLHFSQLYGMSDNITFNLAHAGFNASKYVPYGSVRDVVPYLMRRAKENTSVSGQSSRELSLLKKELKRRKL